MGNKQGKSTTGISSNQVLEPGQGANESEDIGPVSPERRAGREHKGAESVATENQNTTIPIDQFNKFLNCLKAMPFDIDENEFQNIAAHLQIVTVDKGESILEKGRRGKGIYLVASGGCEVLSDTNEVLRVIKDEDFFGEVSSFYGRPCTTTVVSSKNGTELLWLPRDILENVLHVPVDFPVGNWFVKRRYVDVDGIASRYDVVKETLIDTVKEAAPFHGWPLEAIKTVVEAVIAEDGIICYSEGSELFSSGEVDTNGWLIINGEVELLSATDQSLEVLSAWPTGLWFGDEQLFCYTERQITARANTPCIAAIFKAEHFQRIAENFPVEQAKLIELSLSWKRFTENKDSNLQDKYAGKLGSIMTQVVLRKSALLSLVPHGMVYRMALNVIHRHLKKDQLVFTTDEMQHKMFVVFAGVVVVESHSTVSSKKLEMSHFYYPTEIEPDDVSARALQDSIVGIIDVMSFKAVQDLYPEGVINWDRTLNIVGHC